MLLSKKLLVFVVAALPILLSFADQMQIKPRIINGHRAKLGQFPWQVLLKSPKSNASACGASIISSRWVLSAGHCSWGVTEFEVIVGVIDLNDPNAQNMTSKEIYLHDGYKYGDMKDDISLIKLPKDLQFNENVKAIALPTVALESDQLVGEEGITAGFGLTDDKTFIYPKHLYYIKVVILSNKDCAAGLRQPIPGETLCVKGKGEHHKASICQGDSGSALALKQNGTYIQVGITSFSVAKHCEEGYPTGFARVTDYLEWIHNITDISIE